MIAIQPPPLIEVVGAPGVGKSTILQAVATRRPADAPWALDPTYGHGDPWSRLGRLVPRGLYERAHPEFTALLFRALARATLDRPDAEAARMGERTAALRGVFAKLEHAAERVGAGRVLVLDEGFLKHASTLLVERFNEEPFPATLRRPQMPVGYVFAGGPAEQVVARIVGRGKQARAHHGLDPDEMSEITRRSVKYWEWVADRVEAAQVPVLRLDAAHSPEHNAGLVVEFAERLGEAHRVHASASEDG